MKKVFLKSMLLLCSLIVGSLNVWATGVDVTATLTGSALATGAADSYSDHTTPLVDDKGYEYVGRWYNAQANSKWYNMIQIKGYETSGSSRLVLPKFEGKIKSITLSVTSSSATSKNQSGKKAKVKTLVVNSTDYGKTQAEAKKILEADYSTNETTTFTISFDFTSLATDYDGEGLYICNASGSMRIWEVVVVYEVSTIPVTIGTTGWATFCSRNALNFSETGVTAYQIKETGSGIEYEAVTNTPANAGLILHGTAGNYNIPAIASASALNDNKLIGVVKDTEINSTGNKYVLANQGGTLGFYKVGGDVTVPAKKAYLSLSAAVTAPDHFYITDNVENATNIEGIKADDKAVKFFENGQLLIKRDGVVYDALGRVVR